MGMGFGANYAWTISIEKMKELLPEPMERLERAIEADGGTINEFFRWCSEEGVYIGDNPEKTPYPLSLRVLEDDVRHTFAMLSSERGSDDEEGCYCLQLYPYFHNSSEEGDRYDDVDGAFFVVDGVEEMTPAGKKMADHIEKSFYVTYG